MEFLACGEIPTYTAESWNGIRGYHDDDLYDEIDITSLVSSVNSAGDFNYFTDEDLNVQETSSHALEVCAEACSAVLNDVVPPSNTCDSTESEPQTTSRLIKHVSPRPFITTARTLCLNSISSRLLTFALCGIVPLQTMSSQANVHKAWKHLGYCIPSIKILRIFSPACSLPTHASSVIY